MNNPFTPYQFSRPAPSWAASRTENHGAGGTALVSDGDADGPTFYETEQEAQEACDRLNREEEAGTSVQILSEKIEAMRERLHRLTRKRDRHRRKSKKAADAGKGVTAKHEQNIAESCNEGCIELARAFDTLGLEYGDPDDYRGYGPNR